MTESPEIELPCARGCTWPANEGEEPKPRPAKYGILCSSCYHRVKHALELIPDLMANMRLAITPTAVATYDSERVSSSSSSPAPLRIDPLDASDSLYAKLVSWTEVIGGALNIPQPSVAVWISFVEVMGSKPVTAEKALEIATQLTGWFLVRLTDIAKQSFAADFHDDICYGFNDDNRGVFSLAGSYGVEPRPVRPADKRECPVCGRREVFVAWPSTLNPEVMVMCDKCKWVAEPERYDFYARLFDRAG